jgi:hypothetical protein
VCKYLKSKIKIVVIIIKTHTKMNYDYPFMVKGVLIRRPRLCGLVFPTTFDMNNPLKASKSS